MKSLVVFFTSLVATVAVIPFVRLLAFKLSVLDYPGGRKIHSAVTPLLGGLALYAGLMAGLAACARLLSTVLPIIIGATLILIVGLIEDKRGLSALIRFIVQLAIACGMLFFDIRVSFLPDTWWGNTIEVLMTLVWIVGLTNAYNYLDGMDGLAAGSAAINLFFFSAILYGSSQYPIGLLAIAIIGACCGFLPFNFSRKAKLFLGESGSTFLGFTLACIGLQGHWAQDNYVKLFIPILILGVPIFDMIFTTIMRIKEEKVRSIIEWLRYGGRDHFHHYLVDLGLHPAAAVVFIYFITISLGISAVMISNDTVLEGVLTVYQASIIFGVIATLMVVGKRRRSGWQK